MVQAGPVAPQRGQVVAHRPEAPAAPLAPTGSPDVRTSFSVTRSAPGIFTQSVNGELFAVAAHEDGSPVTLDSDPSTRMSTWAVCFMSSRRE